MKCEFWFGGYELTSKAKIGRIHGVDGGTHPPCPNLHRHQENWLCRYRPYSLEHSSARDAKA